MRRFTVVALLVALWRAGSTSPVSATAGFGDVDEGRFYAPAVTWMAREGITTGTSPGCFSPQRAVSRGEVATFLYRLMDEPVVSNGAGFADVADDAYFADAVAWMAREGITVGTSPSRFSPQRAVTRGEVATFLYRLMDEPPVTVEDGGVCADAPTIGNGDEPDDDGDGQSDGHGGGDSDELPEELLAALVEAEAASLALLNELRASVGAAPLVRVSQLDASARSWSHHLHEQGSLAHSEWPSGENLAWWSKSSASPVDAALKMQQLWEGSGGHFVNMIQASYTEVGIGFFCGPDGWYATHIFRN